MTDGHSSLPVTGDLSSSIQNQGPGGHPAVPDNSAADLIQPRAQDVTAGEDSSAETQTQPVPPIRSLTTRRGFQFPSFESLRSHHFSSAHATSDTPIKRQASAELRASLAKLESLLQEAAHLADRVTFHGQDAGATAPNHEKKESVRVVQVQEVKTDAKSQEKLARRPADLLKPVTKGTKDLTFVDSSIAHPVLTLPVSRSAEDILWKETSHCVASLATGNHALGHTTVSTEEQAQTTACPISPTISVSPRASLSRGRPTFLHPHVGPRSSSLQNKAHQKVPTLMVNDVEVRSTDDFEKQNSMKEPLPKIKTDHERHYSAVFGLPSRQVSINLNHAEDTTGCLKIDLRRKSFVDVYNKPTNFDVHRTCNHGTIARNWPDSRKRFTALIACLNTGCIGLVLGIYAGEVPAIQYALADFNHYSILGNVLLYSGMAVTGLVFWPLPLLHGRKPYVVAAQLLALVLQVPQGLAVNGWRDPSQPAYRCLLLVSRALSGLALGLADMNIKATLLDCFGASLQSRNSGPSKQDLYDVRHHGGGMGMWLGFVSWSTVGPMSVGFMIGASIVSLGVSVSWGFWVCFCIIIVVLLINIIMPEVRRSAFRRTLSELTGDAGEFSRVTRGEIKMHLTSTGPY